MKIQNITFTTIPLMIACFALSPKAQAVVPPPDGGYPGGNTAEGQAALLSLTTGGFNTADGFLALRNNIAGQLNTAVGAGTLLANLADENTATGAGALLSNTIGLRNTANGAFVLFSNTEGSFNTASGEQALFSNTTGNLNTAVGLQALFSNTDGFRNTANGLQALFSNTSGPDNTATGAFALYTNVTGSDNTATGADALFSNTTGFENTADGVGTLALNTTGSNNTAIGINALSNNTVGGGNTAIGGAALFNNSTGGGNVALGFAAGSNLTTGSHNVYIGADMNGVSGESDACYIRSIFGQTSSGGTGVFINSAGKLGTTNSSKRFKDDIKPMNTASEALFALKPVRFRYKKAIDPQGILQFGLVAEDVEAVNPDLVVRDKQGKVNTVRYDQVNAMLLNEFLKEHRKVEAQQSKIDKQEATMTELRSNIAQQQEEMDVLVMRLEEQASQIQKVSAQIGVSKPAPQTVVNNR